MDSFYGSAKWAAGVFIGFALTANYYEFRKYIAAKRTLAKFSLKHAILAMSMPLLCMGLPFFAIYRQIVKIILSMTYGSKFGGILRGEDANMHIQFKNPIETLFIVKYKSNSSKSFCDAVKEAMRKSLLTGYRNLFPKMFGIIQENLGYTFILKDEVSFEDCFKTLRKIDSSTGEISKSDLRKLMDELIDIPLPNDSKAFWHVFVGTQPVSWKTNTKEDFVKYYPVIARFNHALADGAHFFRSVFGLFADKEAVEYKNPLSISNVQENRANNANNESNKGTSFSIPEIFKHVGRQLTYYTEQCFAAIITPGISYGMFLTLICDEYHQRPTLQNQYIRYYKAEESPHYIPIVKRIKLKFPGTSFEDIILTGIATSLNEYFKNKSKIVPEYLTVPVAVEPNIKKIMESPSKGGKFVCENTTIVRLCKLPVGLASEGSHTALVNSLESIKEERMLSRNNTTELMMFRFVSEMIIEFVPNWIRAMFMSQADLVMLAVSSLPGPLYFTVLDGCPIEDVFMFDVNPPDFNMLLLSYNDRQQVTMSVNKAWVSDESEIQDIIEGMYKAIDLLDKSTLQEKMRNT